MRRISIVVGAAGTLVLAAGLRADPPPLSPEEKAQADAAKQIYGDVLISATDPVTPRADSAIQNFQLMKVVNGADFSVGPITDAKIQAARSADFKAALLTSKAHPIAVAVTHSLSWLKDIFLLLSIMSGLLAIIGFISTANTQSFLSKAWPWSLGIGASTLLAYFVA